MASLLFLPALLQAIVMLADEGWCHRRRGLPLWERVGHPLDTLTMALCYTWLAIARPGDSHALLIYVSLSIFSCLFVTKDEFVHASLCGPMESWLHSVLFVLHPIVLLCFGIAWAAGLPPLLFQFQTGLTLAFASYQVLYWRHA
jgi:hypothetical protein